MSKLLINDQNQLLVGSNGKAYAVGNVDALIGSTSPATVTAAAGKVLKLLRYGKCEQAGTPTPASPQAIKCNNGTLTVVDDELPMGYKRITGITFEGNTYYETNEKLYGSDIVTMTISDFESSGQNLFGCYSGTTAGVYNFSLYIYGTSTGQAYWRYGQTLYRPTVGSTSTRTITFGAGGTTGFKNDVTYSDVDFETTTTARIGALPNSSSPKFDGTILGSITIGQRLKYVPCERVSDGVIGYYEVVNGEFLEPNGSTPTAGAYDTSHITKIAIVGTAEEITLGVQSASVENLLSVGSSYKDEQNVISGTVTHKCGVKIYDGTENWVASDTTGIFMAPLWNKNHPNNTRVALVSNYYPGTNAMNSSMPDGFIKGGNSTALNVFALFVKDTDFSSVDDIKAWVADQYAAGTPLIVVYPLPDVTTEQVTAQPLNTVAGSNTLTDTAEVSNPEYNLIYKI